MSNWIKYLIAVLISLSIGFCVGYFVKKSNIKYVKVPITVSDTIVVHKDSIINKTNIKYVNRIDTFYLTPASDTVYLEDIPIEYKHYQDVIETDSTKTLIDIDYSGFDAEIDSISLVHQYYKNNIYPIEKPRKYGLDLVIGPGFGYGYDILYKQHHTYVGINMTIGFGLRLTK